jgi:hypothetical protein
MMVGTGRAPRTWENLPSVAMAAVPPTFAYSHLVQAVLAQAPDKRLLCLVGSGRATSPEDATRFIDLLYEFADDPQLAVMRFLAPVPGEEQIIVGVSSMREAVSQADVPSLYDLADSLQQPAREKGLHTLTTE